MYLDDIDYAARRLNNTVVRLQDGTPVFVSRTFFSKEGEMTHRVHPLDKSSARDVRHTDLNLEPVSLGYVNLGEDIAYISRKPMRRDWKQGLSHNSMVVKGNIPVEDVQMSWLIQPILQKYPNFRRALEDLNKRRAIAFSREFGLTRDAATGVTRLLYRHKPVGVVVNGVPSLDRGKEYLYEHLEEVLAR